MIFRITLFSITLLPSLVHAQDLTADATRALTWVAVGAVVPLLAVVGTAFAKASVLLGILRGGLGVPGVLPATVVTGLAAVLAVLVMLPTARQVAEAVGPISSNDSTEWVPALERAWPVIDTFLVKHTDPADTKAIHEALQTLSPEALMEPPERVAAFLISELNAAFQLGVLLLLPFLIVDLLVANTLVTVGFNLVPPVLVALPFKLLLFVAADGWQLLVRGFIEGYT